jgi:hypothetical protein
MKPTCSRRKPVSSRAEIRAGRAAPRRALLLACIAAAAVLAPVTAAAQEWRTVSSSRSVAGETVLRVDVEYGAGTLTVGPAAAGTLYRTRIRYDGDSLTPVVDYTAGRLQLGLEGTARGRNIRAGELDLRLGPDVPVELALKFGAAEASLDLGGIAVRSLDVQTGASKTQLAVSAPNTEVCRSARIQVGAARFEATGLGNLNAERLTVQGGVGEVVLDFTGAWAGSMDAHVGMGLGSLTLRLPRGLGVQVTRAGRLSSFDGQELTRRGDVYYSENWESAHNRLSMTIDAALGAVRVVWVNP